MGPGQHQPIGDNVTVGCAARLGYWAGWFAIGTFLIAGAAALNLASSHFDYALPLQDMPALSLAAGLAGLGAVYLALIVLIPKSVAQGFGKNRTLLWLILGIGLLMRAALFGSEPAFEDDWYRYLWDGGIAAAGHNPYAVSPDEAQGEPYHYTLQPLARQSGTVIERINHSDVRTIYPPVAVAAFAAANWIAPWSLDAWRAVCLAGEIATAALLLALLGTIGRPPIWIAIYWWNPLAVKELMNSAHMEAIVMPFVLGALLLAIRQRHLAAAASLGLGIGAKIWPVLLAPLILRALWGKPRQLTAAVLLLIGLSALWAWPIIAGGIDETSGFAVYAGHWRNSSAHFGALEWIAQALMPWLDAGSVLPGRMVRLLLACAAGAAALMAARRPIEGAADLLARAGAVTAALFLLSPSQFPWYAVWVLPFAVFRPWAWLVALTLMMPLYYVSFHYAGLDAYEIYRDWIVWLIWLPLWALLAWEADRVGRGEPLFADAIMETGRA